MNLDWIQKPVNQLGVVGISALALSILTANILPPEYRIISETLMLVFFVVGAAFAYLNYKKNKEKMEEMKRERTRRRWAVPTYN